MGWQLCARDPAACETQGELLMTEGCTIQLSVSIGDADASASADGGEDGRRRHEYLFEAAVDGATLLGRDDDDLQFQLVDINGRTGGDFWSTAHEVPAWESWKQM